MKDHHTSHTESGLTHNHKSTLSTLPPEIWVIIVNFFRVHDDDRYNFGQFCPLHKLTLHNLSLTCHAMKSFLEPFLLESVELRGQEDVNAQDLKQGEQVPQYLNDHPESRSLVKYLVLENWKSSIKAAPQGKTLSQIVDDFSNLQGIFMRSVTIDCETYAKLFTLPHLEFVELREVELGQDLIKTELDPNSLPLKALKINHPRLGTATFGCLARCPSLENLEYISFPFHVVDIGTSPKPSYVFTKLTSFRTNEPVYPREWRQLAKFLWRTPNLQSIHLEPHLVPVTREEARSPLPAGMLPGLRQFSGNITSAGCFVYGRPVAKITLLPSLGNPTLIMRNTLVSLTKTSTALRVLSIHEVLIPTHIFQDLPALFPWLEVLEFHITNHDYMRTKPLPVGNLKPLHGLRQARFTSINRQRGFLKGDEAGLKNTEARMVKIMEENHPSLEVLEVNTGVWIRSNSGGLVEEKCYE